MVFANSECGSGAGAVRREARSLLARRAATLLASLVLAFALLGSTGCSSGTGAIAGNSATGAVATAESHLTFRNDRALEEHFEKHGAEVGCRTPEEYLAAANAVIANPAALHKLEAKDGDDVYFLQDTGEFVVVSPKGFIRTYFITDRNYYNRQ